ncbi:MAG TPA: CheR family methyltransferase, partial [Candidatus Rifleibacterium sp.]|nr:CheR family methyltransferase [Candidatus Rifleibacterium sp.]
DPVRKSTMQGLDIIFCRNTMIYFDSDNKQRLTERFFEALNADGYFFTSANEMIHVENLAGVRKVFLENEIIYQKSGGRREFCIFHFVTPADLLRALNILKNNGFDYQLEKIQSENQLEPTRSICINRSDMPNIQELFNLSSIKISNIENLSR